MALDAAACRQQALDLLARREHSRKELERKLARRAYPATTIATTLDQLEQSGALAARRFAENFIRSRVAKGQGPVRIRVELTERGIAATEYLELLDAAGIDWTELAAAVRGKRFGSGRPANIKERARQIRFLQYRGFEMDQINAALDRADA